MLRCLAVVVVLCACSGKHEAAPAPEPVSHAVLPVFVQDAGVADANQADANPLLSMFGAPSAGPSSAQTIAKLEEQARGAPAAEKVLLGKMIAGLRELDAAETDTPREREHAIAGTKMMLEALRGMIDYAKGDANTQRTLISSLSMIPFQVENMGIGDAIDLEAIRQDALARGRALVKAFPRDARAWKMLGWLEGEFVDDHGSSVPAMRAYATCAKLDPSIKECPQLLADYKRRWVEPYCPAGSIKPVIGWYEEGVAAAQFKSKDLARLTATVIHVQGGPVYSGTTGQVIDRSPDRDTPTILIDLAPEAVKPMAKWEREVQDRKHFFEIRVNDRIVASTKDEYYEPRERAVLSISGVALEELCTAPAKRELPADIN